MALHEQHLDVRRITAAVGLLAAIVEGSDDAIIAKNLEGLIISWNPAAERLFGYSEVEVIGKHIGMLIPPDHVGEDTRVLAEVLAGERVKSYETERLRKDGSRVSVSVTVSALRGNNGEVIGASKILRDISESLQARETHARLAAIIESSDDAIIAKDATGHITSWNPAAERLFGYTSEEAVGRPVSMLLPDDLVGRERDILSEILSGSKVDHYETRRVGKDGTEVHVSLTVSPVHDGGGTIVGASKIVHDITEERQLRADRELYATQLAEANAKLEAERFKDQFLAMASHELRTPLTAVSGFTQTLLDIGDQFTPEQTREYLTIISQQAGRLTRLVEDLLLVSRIEADEARGHAEPIDVADTLRQLLREQDVHDVPVHAHGDVVAWVDRDHLQQMVSNFLSNARKYGKPPYEIDLAMRGDMVEIRVRDFGEGVPEDEIELVFDRFSRSQRHVEAQIQGTGLGLAIVRGLAQSQGGDAWYEPNEPEGACFCLSLPVEQPA